MDTIAPGNIFRHIKTGNVYKVLHLATSADTSTKSIPMVVYRRINTSDVYTRSLTQFGNKFMRFNKYE